MTPTYLPADLDCLLGTGEDPTDCACAACWTDTDESHANQVAIAGAALHAIDPTLAHEWHDLDDEHQQARADARLHEWRMRASSGERCGA
jgi:hypothetical protein